MKNDSISIAIASSLRPILRLKGQKRHSRTPQIRQRSHARSAGRTNDRALHPAVDAKAEELPALMPALQSQSVQALPHADSGHASPGTPLVSFIELSKPPLASESGVAPLAPTTLKRDLRRTEGHRVFAGPWASKSRGLPRRKLPAWMLKKSADDLPAKPVRGRRAYSGPSQSDVGEPDNEAVQPLVETLILPGSIPFRRYLQQRLLIFSLTDSISVRRLSEVSSRRRSFPIIVGVCAALLLGLLFVACAGHFYVSDSQGSAMAASGGSTSPTSSPPGHSTSTSSPIVAEPTTLLDPQPTASEPKLELPAGTGSAKAGSVAQSEQEPRPSPVVNLDEQQKTLEADLELAILAMRKAGDAEKYSRENEAAILELQTKFQELFSIRNGGDFGKSPQSLALSRSLASIHLLIGQRRAARNLLLDLQDAVSATRPKDDPEMRLLERLLHQVDPVSSESNDGSPTTKSPLTPSEMKALLVEF